MKYSVSVSFWIPSIVKEVEANNEDEAKLIVKKMAEDAQKSINPSSATFNTSTKVLDINWLYKPNSIYLIKYYSSYLPAKCVSSFRAYSHKENKKWVHNFRFLKNNKDITVYGRKGTGIKVGKMLCEDGKLKEACNDCPAKFLCLTIREK
jgi:hypothetical protein